MKSLCKTVQFSMQMKRQAPNQRRRNFSRTALRLLIGTEFRCSCPRRFPMIEGQQTRVVKILIHALRMRKVNGTSQYESIPINVSAGIVPKSARTSMNNEQDSPHHGRRNLSRGAYRRFGNAKLLRSFLRSVAVIEGQQPAQALMLYDRSVADLHALVWQRDLIVDTLVA